MNANATFTRHFEVHIERANGKISVVTNEWDGDVGAAPKETATPLAYKTEDEALAAMVKARRNRPAEKYPGISVVAITESHRFSI